LPLLYFHNCFFMLLDIEGQSNAPSILQERLINDFGFAWIAS
jgi:hypothetical protein